MSEVPPQDAEFENIEDKNIPEEVTNKEEEEDDWGDEEPVLENDKKVQTALVAAKVMSKVTISEEAHEAAMQDATASTLLTVGDKTKQFINDTVLTVSQSLQRFDPITVTIIGFLLSYFYLSYIAKHTTFVTELK